MQQYLTLLDHVLANGEVQADRTGVGTISVVDYTMRFDLSKGFPLLTTKKLHFPSIAHELLWFLKGVGNIGYLKDMKVSIWDEWASESGELGPVYPVQWRHWVGGIGKKEVDQIATLIEGLRSNPASRRHIVTAWNPSELEDMALPPCHAFFQCFVRDGYSRFEAKTDLVRKPKLSLKLTQRSADCFLGVPYNIASYALLIHMLAMVCNMEPGELIWSGGDVHIYLNHLDQVKLQLQREPRELPELDFMRELKNIDEFRFDDFRILGYDPHPHIPGKVAV